MMEQGKTYRIIFDVGMKLPREAIFRFLSETHQAALGAPAELHFDARPLAGTQSLSRRDVLAVFETNDKLMLPRIYRGQLNETRVL